MSTAIPETMRACVVQENGTVAVQQIPVPTLKPNEILVKVYAVAQNPTDWKSAAYMTVPGSITGVDFAGVVVKLGDQVDDSYTVKIGDRVSGFTHGGLWPDYGSYAEYTKVEADLVWIVPSNTTFEEAATMNVGLLTAVQAFYHSTRLGLPEPPAPENGKWIFIYGGSTSVGLYAIQLAHLSGYKVATVASPKNHALLKELGADAVFDYKQSDVVDQIRNVTGNSISIGLDTHATEDSQLLSVRTFGPSGGHLIVILGPSDKAAKERPDVKIQPTILYTALGRAFAWPKGLSAPASPEDRAQLAHFLPKLTRLVEAGSIRSNPTKIWEGGLENVQQGFDYMREGKVSAEKIVYKVSE